jgi:hypothetical protein
LLASFLAAPAPAMAMCWMMIIIPAATDVPPEELHSSHEAKLAAPLSVRRHSGSSETHNQPFLRKQGSAAATRSHLELDVRLAMKLIVPLRC